MILQLTVHNSIHFTPSVHQGNKPEASNHQDEVKLSILFRCSVLVPFTTVGWKLAKHFWDQWKKINHLMKGNWGYFETVLKNVACKTADAREDLTNKARILSKNLNKTEFFFNDLYVSINVSSCFLKSFYLFFKIFFSLTIILSLSLSLSLFLIFL